jgi:hypothetical protein
LPTPVFKTGALNRSATHPAHCSDELSSIMAFAMQFATDAPGRSSFTAALTGIVPTIAQND